MRTLLFSITLFSLNSFADYMDRDCEKANISVSITVQDRFVYPKFVYLKQDDVVCFEIENQTENLVSFAFERQPLTDSLRPMSERRYSLKFSKIGEYKIKIRGVYFSERPVIIVLDKVIFENFERREYLKKSIKGHH